MEKRKAYILVCTSNKPKQWNAGCCCDKGGETLLKAFETFIKKNQLGDYIIAKKSGCVNNCSNGISVRMLNDGIIYSNVSQEDIPDIAEGHGIYQIPVQRLLKEYSPENDH
ncbi:MAG: (2Fe-2S) ferredoxin domain-containing protein [Bacteroidetes bacterium]|nr:(2Fe-2S) ferredoxin domain-containing protein [Bacteroidota bacterium]MCB0845987.1 (2Fe-2S) ferredoxin domain-containing protein [Bacteroidota bacterium]